MGLQLVQLLFQRIKPAAALSQPAGVALKAQIAVPGLHRIHHLAAILHDHSFVEQHHRIAGSQFVGAPQIVQRRGAIVFAAGTRAALKVRGCVVHQQPGSYRPVSQQPVENVNGRIEFFFEHVGASFKLKPVRILWRALKLACNAGARIQQPGRFAARRAAAQMRLLGYLGKSRAGHAQLKDAGVRVGLGQQPLRSVGALPAHGDRRADQQRCRQSGSHPKVQPRSLLARRAMGSAGKLHG